MEQSVGGDYYVLPSSVHEVLIVPQSAGMDPEELTDMVNTVNEGCVMQDEILSDHVYQYDAKEHKLSLCAPAKEMKQMPQSSRNKVTNQSSIVAEVISQEGVI